MEDKDKNKGNRNPIKEYKYLLGSIFAFTFPTRKKAN